MKKNITSAQATDTVIKAFYDVNKAILNARAEIDYLLVIYEDLSKKAEINLNQQERALIDIFEDIPFDIISNLLKEAGYKVK